MKNNFVFAHMNIICIAIMTIALLSAGMMENYSVRLWIAACALGNYNSLYDREDIKDRNGNVIGYRKWNSLYDRYDVFYSYGTLVGYYKWNDLYDRWEYHEQ